MEKRLLIVTPWIPYPITGADQQDRFEGFKQLKALGHDLHIIAKIHAFQNKADIERFYADAGLKLTLVYYTASHASLVLKRLGRIVTEPALLDGAALEYTDPLTEKTIRDTVVSFQPDCAWVEFSFLWPVVRLIHSLGVPSVLRSANNEAQQSIDEHGGSLRARIMAIPRFRGERLAARESAHVCAITPWEEKWYRSCGSTHVSVLPLRGLPRVLRQKKHADKNVIDVVFLSSSYTNGHNRDALKFLLTKIIPALPGRHPFHFHVTGKKFPSSYRPYLTEAVTVHDFIDDLDTFLDTMDIAVCPSVSGQGMQQKIFEPLCIGLPLVTHHTAGYPYEDGKHVLLAQTAAGYVDALLSFRDTARRQHIADAAYHLSHTLFSREQMERIAELAIDDALSSHRS